MGLRKEEKMLTARRDARAVAKECWSCSWEAAAAAGRASMMLFAGLGGSGGRLLGVPRSMAGRGDGAGEKGCLRKEEMARMSRTGVASTTGSSAVTLWRAERGFSSGAKRPLGWVSADIGRDLSAYVGWTLRFLRPRRPAKVGSSSRSSACASRCFLMRAWISSLVP